MSIETDCRKQFAVYWAKTGVDNYGEVTVGTAKELKVRWELDQKEVLLSTGETVAVEAVLVVDRVIAVGSLFWKGKLVELPGTSTTPTSDVYQAVVYSEIPDIKARKFRREVGLILFRDTLP